MIIEHKEDLHPQIIISDDHGEVVANYPIPSGAHIVVNEADKIVPGTLLAKTPRKQAKTRDITGGLPRVAELFEARRPKDAAIVAEIEGSVEYVGVTRGMRKYVIRGEDGQEHRPYMVHRALLGSLERFFGVLVEHYAGAFPAWLAPVPADVLPVTDQQNDYAREVVAALRSAGFRAEGSPTRPNAMQRSPRSRQTSNASAAWC